MSTTLLVLVIFFIVLYLGFRYGAWSLGLLTVAMILGISFLMASVDIEAVKKDWGNRRCDVDVFLLGFLYKPSDDPRSAGDFAGENFSFCVRQMFREVMEVLLTPIISALGSNVKSAAVLTDVFQALRTLKSKIQESFAKLMDPFYRRFIATGAAYARNFGRLYSAMKRVGGIAVASVYMTMGLQMAIESFVRFVVKVVLIIIFVIAALLILIWFGIIPFLFIIFTVITFLEVGGFGEMLGDTRGTFCFDPNTSMETKDGETKPLSECKVGDILADGSVIEGVLSTDGRKEPLYSVDGILVSASHLIWSDVGREWIEASKLPGAIPIHMSLPVLICLRTSSRNIIIRGKSQKQWKFRDWEELPLSEPNADKVWDWLVNGILNERNMSTGTIPTQDPLFGAECKVFDANGKRKDISEIKLGDKVLSNSGYTRVIGVYKGVADMRDAFSFSDGVWLKTKMETNWCHPEFVERGNKVTGYHLITEAGSFRIEANGYSGYARDFTEVGSDQLYLTYSFTQALLKKSSSREESCVSDSLLQDFLSYSLPIF